MERGSFHVGYCTNVHPGETLADLARIIDGPVAAVRARVAGEAALGTGLRLGHRAVAQLGDPDERARLADRLQAAGLYVFTVNGFPYGDFAADAVKAAVYAPDWRDPARLAYTVALAEVVAALPGPSQRTISTVAGGFGPQTATTEARAAIAAQLAQAGRYLADLADRTGVQIRLCLEPEPWTTLETTDDALAFFAGPLADAEAPIADHLGLCYDCCHQAVYFEDAADSVRRLVEGGVPIGKVQVSSALHLDRPGVPDRRAALQAFAEPRYLHQVVGRLGDRRLRALDLPDVADPDPEWLQADAWRCHFHVPIAWRGDAVLGTTRADWEAAIGAVAGHCAHLEIETYTWHVLPASARAQTGGDDLVASVAAEFAALLAVI